MGKNGIKWLVLVVILFAFYACTKQAQYISTVTPSENPYLVQIDSFNGNFVVYREDSFITSNDAFALIGHHNDPLFGNTQSSFYSRFNNPGIQELSNATKFDSIELILKTGKHNYGDSMQPFTVVVSRLAESIANDDDMFYNNTEFATDGKVMGTATKILRPSADDSLSIPLDKAFGLELFSLIKAKATQVSSSDRFVEYFKGLRIQTDSLTTAQVVGFQKNMTIRLHYHEDDGNIIQKHIDLGSAASPYQFNHIDRNFIGSALAPLQAAKEVKATDLQNRFFIQNLFRIRTRISFPAIGDLLKISDFVKILNAQIELKPTRASWVNYPLPAGLNVYQLKADQTLSAALTNSGGGTQEGNLSIDQIYGEQTSYVFDVTDYLINELTTNAYTTQQLVLLQASSDSSLHRFAGNTTNAAELRSRLIISTLVYSNQ